jgi:purine-binding chemotaxis protein CheW
MPDLPGAALADSATEYLVFQLGGQEYAISAQDVDEVRAFEPPVRKIGSAPFALGVLNVRGASVTILDLRLRLGLVAHFGSGTTTLLLRLPSGMTGVVVDSVSGTVRLASHGIRPMAVASDSRGAGLIKGLAMICHNGWQRPLVVMDCYSLLPAGKPYPSLAGLASWKI